MVEGGRKLVVYLKWFFSSYEYSTSKWRREMQYGDHQEAIIAGAGRIKPANIEKSEVYY